MKKIQYKIIVPSCLALLILIYSCGKNFLDKPPIGTLSPEIVANASGVHGLLIGAYSILDGNGGNNGGWGAAADNWAYGNVSADDAYKGSTPSDQGDVLPLEQWAAVPTNSYPLSKWDEVYDGIQRCNTVLRTMRLATDMTPADTLEVSAEARFLRAFYHMELRKVFHYPPYVDESITVPAGNYNVPNIDGSGNYIEIYPKIEADLLYAIGILPDKQTYKGQINKSGANAVLAKLYMFEQKFAQAKTILDQLITSGVTSQGVAYALQTNYQNNFNPDGSAKNSSESVWACQMSVNDGSGAVGNGGNGNYGDALNFPYGGGPGACCGFMNPSQDLANAFKTDANGLPLLDGSFNSGANVDSAHGPYTGTLDPRIDWVMGRKNVPYLDWGPHPGDTWIRSPADDGHFNPKKNVYAKSQQGTLSDNENYWANVELSANNVNFIRFADILLWDAECEVEVGSLDQAQTYVNQVRARAANPTSWVYTDGTFDATTFTYKSGTVPADNYKIGLYPTGAFATNGQAYARNAIRFERRLELAEEGHRFFDLQRWDVATPGYMAGVLNAYAQRQAVLFPAEYGGVSFTQGKSEYFAIPQQQIDAENGAGTKVLKQIPGY